jgi:ATP-dependent DNA ligase
MDGFRAGVSVDAGQVVLRSRHGTDMTPAFPEVVAGALQLPDATALDCELLDCELVHHLVAGAESCRRLQPPFRFT